MDDTVNEGAFREYYEMHTRLGGALLQGVTADFKRIQEATGFQVIAIVSNANAILNRLYNILNSGIPLLPQCKSYLLKFASNIVISLHSNEFDELVDVTDSANIRTYCGTSGDRQVNELVTTIEAFSEQYQDILRRKRQASANWIQKRATQNISATFNVLMHPYTWNAGFILMKLLDLVAAIRLMIAVSFCASNIDITDENLLPIVKQLSTGDITKAGITGASVYTYEALLGDSASKLPEHLLLGDGTRLPKGLVSLSVASANALGTNKYALDYEFIQYATNHALTERILYHHNRVLYALTGEDMTDYLNIGLETLYTEFLKANVGAKFYQLINTNFDEGVCTAVTKENMLNILKVYQMSRIEEFRSNLVRARLVTDSSHISQYNHPFDSIQSSVAYSAQNAISAAVVCDANKFATALQYHSRQLNLFAHQQNSYISNYLFFIDITENDIRGVLKGKYGPTDSMVNSFVPDITDWFKGIMRMEAYKTDRENNMQLYNVLAAMVPNKVVPLTAEVIGVGLNIMSAIGPAKFQRVATAGPYVGVAGTLARLLI